MSCMLHSNPRSRQRHVYAPEKPDEAEKHKPLLHGHDAEAYDGRKWSDLISSDHDGDRLL